MHEAVLVGAARTPGIVPRSAKGDTNMRTSAQQGLFSPIGIGTLSLANRIVMPPMWTRKASSTGEVTDRLIQHYLARGKAHPGLIIIEVSSVIPGGELGPRVLRIDSDDCVSGLERLATAIKGTGTSVAIQLAHAGAHAPRSITGQRPVAPSEIIPPRGTETPRELTINEIIGLVTVFGDAALRAAKAGFDAVELHGAHGYLLSQFVSPYTNRRHDAYGGTLEGRIRFPLEVVAEVRRRLGPTFPLVYRLGASDLMPDGLTVEEGTAVASRLANAGVDLLDISGGLSGDGQGITEQGYFVHLAETVKKVVNIPVVGVGNITDPQYADEIIREGRVDLVAIGRAMLTNPNWAAEAAKRLRA